MKKFWLVAALGSGLALSAGSSAIAAPLAPSAISSSSFRDSNVIQEVRHHRRYKRRHHSGRRFSGYGYYGVPFIGSGGRHHRGGFRRGRHGGGHGGGRH